MSVRDSSWKGLLLVWAEEHHVAPSWSQAFQQECVSEWELVRHRPEEAGDKQT